MIVAMAPDVTLAVWDKLSLRTKCGLYSVNFREEVRVAGLVYIVLERVGG